MRLDSDNVGEHLPPEVLSEGDLYAVYEYCLVVMTDAESPYQASLSSDTYTRSCAEKIARSVVSSR